MKRISIKVIILSIILCNALFLSSQTVSITEDSTYIGENSAILDIKSNNKGFLPPRLTSSERQSINNPAAGLIVYDLDYNLLFHYNGNLWEKLINESALDSIKLQLIEMQILTGVLLEDADGNVYKTVKIGNQRWMAENMRTTKNKSGNPITLVTDNSLWVNTNNPAYCWYDNDSLNNSKYGALYNYDAAQAICPTGWHLPSLNEWMTLSNYSGVYSGGKLKEVGTSHWSSPNSGATNESNFTALPSGLRTSFNGTFWNLSKTAFFYSTTIDYLNYFRYIFELHYDSASFNSDTYPENTGASVRCIKD